MYALVTALVCSCQVHLIVLLRSLGRQWAIAYVHWLVLLSRKQEMHASVLGFL